MKEFLVRELAVNSFNRFKTTCESGGCVIYDYFIEKGIIKRNPEEIKEAMSISVAYYKRVFHALSEKELRQMAIVINRAKAICVDNFYTELKMSEKSIEDFL